MYPPMTDLPAGEPRWAAPTAVSADRAA